MGIQCHSSLLPSACCQVAASPANVPVAKLHSTRTDVANVQKMKNQHLSFLFSLTWPNIKQVASMCQIAQLQVAKSLMPRALLPSARCQVPVPSVPSLHLPGIEMTRLKTNYFKLSSSEASTHPFPFQQPSSPLLQQTCFGLFGCFEFHLFHK